MSGLLYVWHDSEPGRIGTGSMSSSCTPSIRLHCQDREAGLVRKLLALRHRLLPTTWKADSLFEQGWMQNPVSR